LKAITPYKISYALAWRNAGFRNNEQYEFYAPYKGQLSANDFVEFYKNDKTLFQKDIGVKKLYE
jgi:mannan endo-1,4-beta-mannosidase